MGVEFAYVRTMVVAAETLKAILLLGFSLALKYDFASAGSWI